MKTKSIFFIGVLLLCALLIPGRVQAAETEHSYTNGICTQCGAVESAYLSLSEDTIADWSLSQDLYLNLNGYDLTGQISTNGYAVYGMDTATQNYTYGSMGCFNCTDEAGKRIIPQKHVLTDEQITGVVHRYMTVPTEDGYTFHRFYLGITHTSLRPDVTGLGYKALFCGDDMVKAQLDDSKAFGYTLQLGDFGAVRRYVSAEQLTSEAYITLRVQNWDVDNYGETQLLASVGLTINDGTWIQATEHTTTMRQQVESISASYKSFSKTQLDAVRGMIQRNPLMKYWDVDNLFFVGYAPATTPQTGKAYKFGMKLTADNYYFTGSISTYYLATLTDISQGADVYLEPVTGGYALYFMNGNVKTYINVTYYSGSTGTMKLVTGSTPTVYNWNTLYQYLYTTVNSATYYLGTYSTYTTIRASSTSFISDTSKIGVSQFTAWFYEPAYDYTLGTEEETDTPTTENCETHTDTNNDGSCDLCYVDVTVTIDLYAVNDLHGKLADADSHPGVDELSTYLNNAKASKDNVILLSSGDMWQGAAESNLTKGLIITDWMNQMGFVSMTMGNHEYDWGKEAITQNEAFAQFPFLAINIYDRETNAQVDYCQSSVVVEADGVQIGIIGAIGDCYSSISTDRRQDVYFLTGTQLTNLVKEEATRLRNEGVDFIVYSLHDGYSSTSTSGYYDESLSNGYVDLVFEAHTHQGYVQTDSYGVYHLQGGGDNKGITYASVTYNTANGSSQVTQSQYIRTSTYSSLEDDPIVTQLLEKYDDQVSLAYKVLGTNPSKLYSSTILQTVADLYYQAGQEKWGDQYNIVLGGGYLNCRSPYNLEAGEVTYGMLMSLLPFDNRLVLCKITGQNLLNNFINTTNSNYYVGYGPSGSQIADIIVSYQYYYVIVDTYSAYYAPNKLTVVDFYDEDVYARDLLAQYIEQGNLG